MPAPERMALETALPSQQMQRALQEAVWAARILLHLDASVIFLTRQSKDHLEAAAWHGREAEGVSISAQKMTISPRPWNAAREPEAL